MDRQAQRYIRRKLNCWQFAEEFGSKDVVNDCLVCYDPRPIAHRLTVESEFEGAVVRVRCPFEMGHLRGSPQSNRSYSQSKGCF